MVSFQLQLSPLVWGLLVNLRNRFKFCEKYEWAAPELGWKWNVLRWRLPRPQNPFVVRTRQGLRASPLFLCQWWWWWWLLTMMMMMMILSLVLITVIRSVFIWLLYVGCRKHIEQRGLFWRSIRSCNTCFTICLSFHLWHYPIEFLVRFERLSPREEEKK